MNMQTLRKDKPAIGITLILANSLIAVIGAIISRLMTENGMHALETVFYRNLLAFIAMGLYILTTRKYTICHAARPKMQIARAIFGNLSIVLIFWGYSMLPVATVSAIMLTSPLFAIAVSPFLLGEKVGITRWLCVLLGLSGALIITQPGSGDFSIYHIIAILGAMTAGSINIFLRDLSKDHSTLTTLFWMYGIGIIFLAPFMPFVWSGLPSAYILVIAIAANSLIEQSSKTAAFKFAEASLLSPFKYSNVVWAALLGFAIWQEIPEIHVYVGCAIIIISNLLIVWHQRRSKKRTTEIL